MRDQEHLDFKQLHMQFEKIFFEIESQNKDCQGDKEKF